MKPQFPSAVESCQPIDESGLLELARVFAAGVIRLHKAGHLGAGPAGLSAKNALKTASQDLEQTAETRLSVTRGLRSESPKKRRH